MTDRLECWSFGLLVALKFRTWSVPNHQHSAADPSKAGIRSGRSRTRRKSGSNGGGENGTLLRRVTKPPAASRPDNNYGVHKPICRTRITGLSVEVKC